MFRESARGRIELKIAKTPIFVSACSTCSTHAVEQKWAFLTVGRMFSRKTSIFAPPCAACAGTRGAAQKWAKIEALYEESSKLDSENVNVSLRERSGLVDTLQNVQIRYVAGVSHEYKTYRKTRCLQVAPQLLLVSVNKYQKLLTWRFHAY